MAFRHWSAENAMGVLIHVHGIESHSGWFSETASTLSEQGYEIYTPDRLGSGLSDGNRGDVKSWRVWLRHVREIIEIARSENPGVPLFLAGSCWGAKVCLQMAL